MPKVKARSILAIISIIGYIAITAGFVAILFFGENMRLPDGELGKQIVGMLGMIVGTWNAAVLMVYTFHYGSSEGSKDKDLIMKTSGLNLGGKPDIPSV